MGVFPLVGWVGQARLNLVFQKISSTTANNSASQFGNGQIGFTGFLVHVELLKVLLWPNPGLDVCIFGGLRFSSLVPGAQAETLYCKICNSGVCQIILLCWEAEFAAGGGSRTCLFRSDQRSLLQPQAEKSLQLGKYCKKRLSRRGHVFASVMLAFCKHSCKQPFVCTVKQNIAETIL